MAVLIKNMEMPQNCNACWALDDYGDYPRCRITEEQRGYNFPVRERRMDKCPLIEAKEEVSKELSTNTVTANGTVPAFVGAHYSNTKTSYL